MSLSARASARHAMKLSKMDLHDKIDTITGDRKAIILNKRVVGEFKEKDEKD